MKPRRMRMIFREDRIVDSRKYNRRNQKWYKVSANGWFGIPAHIRCALGIARGDKVLVALNVENGRLFIMKSGKEDTRAFKIRSGMATLYISRGKRVLRKLGVGYESGKVKFKSEIIGDDGGVDIAMFTFSKG